MEKRRRCKLVEKGLKKFVHQYGVEKKTFKETQIQ
jgi:hypothetical protein